MNVWVDTSSLDEGYLQILIDNNGETLPALRLPDGTPVEVGVADGITTADDKPIYTVLGTKKEA